MEQKKYPQNLEDRTLNFAKGVIRLCGKLPHTLVNTKLIDQLIRSAASVGANYREANDGLSKKDFFKCIRISRKEAKETSFWLELLIEPNNKFESEIKPLLQECKELRNILSAIIKKTSL